MMEVEKMKKPLTIRILSLALAFAMMLPAAACSVPKDPSDNIQNPSTPPTEPDAHVCIFGEWELVKEATNTQDGLRERKCECGEVEQEVIKASNTEHYIIYRNLKTADYPEQNGYNSKDGLLNLPQPEAVGYTFIGWYTASIGGELVDYIPEGSTKNYVLYAHWDLIPYEITYKNVPNNTNPTTYNIEDKLKLETPKWSGLVFTHWSDAEGNVYKPDENITALPARMSGDLILTANWKVLRNIATPAEENAKLYNVFSGEEGMLYFFYDLGTIEHVVLDDIDPNLYYKAEGMPISLTLSKTVSVSKETAKSISDTISKSISQTSAWETSHSIAKSHSKNWNAEIGGGINAGIGGGTEGGVGAGIDGLSVSLKKTFNWSVNLHVEGSYNWGGEDTISGEWGQSESYSENQSETQSQTVNSSLAYKEEITSEISENFTIGADLPSGYYAYVHAGNIRVIGIVTYEIATGYMYLNTYSRLDNMHSMVMYYPTVNELNNPSVEGLDFNIPEEEIINKIENSYYVKYDANGGTGTMPTTMHSVNGNEKLATNAFTKPGYAFAGWELRTEDGVKVLQEGEEISNLAEPLHTVTLKALWASTGPVYSEWSEWSDWTLERRPTSDTVKEECATLWAYAYFKCPSCGRHTPYCSTSTNGYTCNTWPDGCGNTKIPDSSWRWVFSEKSYTEAGLKKWYGTGKYYTEIDGQVVFNPEKGQMTVYRYATRTVEE